MQEHEVIIDWSDEDEAFVAEIPALPGCMAHGQTADAALASCQEAMGLWLETARELGRGNQGRTAP